MRNQKTTRSLALQAQACANVGDRAEMQATGMDARQRGRRLDQTEGLAPSSNTDKSAWSISQS